jgi:SPP1 family predicted phage head-tail adaptor
MTTIGAMRERVLLQTHNTTQNTAGETVSTFTDLATVWARVEPFRGREIFAAGHEQAKQPVLFTIRHSSISDQFREEDRITWEGRVYEPQTISHRLHREEFVEILTTYTY